MQQALVLNGQRAGITVPPMSKFVSVGDSGVVSDLVVLPAEANKAYIIHAALITATNSAGTDASATGIGIHNLWDGNHAHPLKVVMTPSVAQSYSMFFNGLNMPTLPGKPVDLYTSGTTVINRGAVVWYSEVFM